MLDLLIGVCKEGQITSNEELAIYNADDDALILHMSCIVKNDELLVAPVKEYFGQFT